MKATFSGTVDILVKAYLNDDLTFADCAACAVGNIVRGSGVYIDGHDDGLNWYRYIKRNGSDFNESIAITQVEATGYNRDQLLKIEAAFESAKRTEHDRMFNGLCAVVDVLAEIHGVDLSVKESAKLLFVKS